MSIASLKEISRRIREAALSAADPRGAVTGNLTADADGITACGQHYRCSGRLILVAIGKASAGMAGESLRVLGSRIAAGIAVVPHGYETDGLRDARIEVHAAGHPVPDKKAEEAARAVLRFVEGMAENDLCLFLVSGGGSSLLSLPRPPITLAELRETASLLLASGADIIEINTVRKHLSAIAGGHLATRCRGTLVTLVLSDVLGDDLSAIASGPTVADPTTFADAAEVLERRALLGRVPLSVRTLIQEGIAGRIAETPKRVPGRHHASVIASGRIAVEAVAKAARENGFTPLVLTTHLSGEAREAGRMMSVIALEAKSRGRPLPAPACLIAGGETTVTVKGSGRGGRNQEIALSAAIQLDGVQGILLTSFATDGREADTTAAGAYATGETAAAGRKAGFDPLKSLASNDAYPFLEATGDLIVTGPTGTNVNDITFALIES